VTSQRGAASVEFAMIVPVLVLLVGLVVGVILIIGGLTFFPALALGPIVEHLAMTANTLF